MVLQWAYYSMLLGRRTWTWPGLWNQTAIWLISLKIYLPAPLGENRAMKAEPTAGLSTCQQEHKASGTGTSFPLLPLMEFKSYALKQGTVSKHGFYILWSRVTSFTRCPGLLKIKSLQIRLPNNPK